MSVTGLLAAAATLTGGALGVGGIVAVLEADHDVPAVAAEAYIKAGADFGVDYRAIACIYQGETNHGRFGGAHIDPVTKKMTPELRNWDVGAYSYGPGQFQEYNLPTYFGPENPDPQNIEDAARATAKYLVSHGYKDDPRTAIRSYNGSGPAAERYADAKMDCIEALPPFSGDVPLVKAVWLPPCDGDVTSGFGHRVPPTEGARAFHPGIDLGCGLGTPAMASAAGEVTFAGWAGGFGNQVQVAHAGGAATSYNHLSEVKVKAGDRVAAGSTVGLVGSTGVSTGPHLHFELWENGEPVDPATRLGQPATGGRAPTTPVGTATVPAGPPKAGQIADAVVARTLGGGSGLCDRWRENPDSKLAPICEMAGAAGDWLME